jgi:hypothetical protein
MIGVTGAWSKRSEENGDCVFSAAAILECPITKEPLIGEAEGLPIPGAAAREE